jgi:hypothetical protein
MNGRREYSALAGHSNRFARGFARLAFLLAGLLRDRAIAKIAFAPVFILSLQNPLDPRGAPAQAAPEMKTGSYVGDGALNRAIAGLDFTPAVVIIKGDINEVAVIRTSTMPGDSSKPMVGGTALTANLVKSLDANGFTVGGDDRVNGSNIKSHGFCAPSAIASGCHKKVLRNPLDQGDPQLL